MPSAQSSNRHPRIMTISPWSIPFFSPQKRVVGSFLREVNVGISCATPTPLDILKLNTTINIISDKYSRDDGMLHLWQCPSVSPHEANVVCPIVLYGAKTVPPTRAERRQQTSIRRRHCTIGTGPNHRRSQRRHLRRNPRPITQTRPLFYTPRRQKQLRDWAFPHTNDSHEASGSTYEDDDDDDTTDFNMSLHMSTSIDEITDDMVLTPVDVEPNSNAGYGDAEFQNRLRALPNNAGG